MLLTTMLFTFALAGSTASQPTSRHATISIQADKPGIRVSPDLYGVFFEEINCAGDGGLYAELVRNRSFEDAEQPAHWSLVERGGGKGSMALSKEEPISQSNPTSLKLAFESGSGFVGVSNEGYWGIPVRKGESYSFSCRVRGDGRPHELRIRLEGADGKVCGETSATVNGPYWMQVTRSLESQVDDPDARLVIGLDDPGSVWLDLVSLFPTKTFKDRSNGLRSDLASKLADLKPSFMRFPGGCWVEGDTMAFSQRWKRTVGELADRRTQPNLWGYVSTNGLGYHEYLQLCEDIGAAPLFVINCGMSHHEIVPMDKMDDFVQDALDAIEYANGPVTSKWGALRAKNGHPEPFDLKYLEIGNENGGAAYRERYPLIARAVKARFPDVKLIANVWGGYPHGDLTEIIDEHYYSNPGFFVENADRYDRYDRKGPKIYVGEYAVTEGCGGGNLVAAVAEAAFMTGMERNSDVVTMSSYAPLFANVNYKKWNPDLINFDNHRVYGTPSYYVQQMFSRNRADYVLPVKTEISSTERAAYPGGGIGVGTWGTQAEFKEVKVVNGDKVLLDSADGSGLVHGAGVWRIADGVLVQEGDTDGARASAGTPAWSRYTLSLKARKTGGREGFLITFGMRDEKNWFWWNIGGWGNHQDSIERCVDGGKSILGQAINGSVETGRWYDLRVEYSPERVRCYVDGKLIHDVPCPQPKPLHIVSGKDAKTGEIVTKIVNSGKQAISTRLRFDGMKGSLAGTREVLTSASPLDENSLEDPLKVSPHSFAFDSSQELDLPAYSVTVLRLK